MMNVANAWPRSKFFHPRFEKAKSVGRTRTCLKNHVGSSLREKGPTSEGVSGTGQSPQWGCDRGLLEGTIGPNQYGEDSLEAHDTGTEDGGMFLCVRKTPNRP